MSDQGEDFPENNAPIDGAAFDDVIDNSNSTGGDSYNAEEVETCNTEEVESCCDSGNEEKGTGDVSSETDANEAQELSRDKPV